METKIALLGDERLDVVNENITLIQKKSGLTFGTDALLLAAFARGSGGGTAADFGAGTGIVSFLTAARGKFAKLYAVEAQPDLQAVIEKLGAQKHYQRAVLQPLMVVAGDHANQDMAGEEEDSWKSRLERAGYQVECRIRGLGEVEAIRKLYVAHVREAEWEK